MISLESKILIYVAVGIIIAIIGVIAVLPNSGILKTLVPQNANVPTALTAISTDIKPIDMQYGGSSVISITDRDAVIESKFSLSNPNNATILVETINYEIYANGVLMGHGQFGQTYEGSFQSSYYLPLVQHNSETISNKAQLHNDGNNPDVWTALQNGTAKITVAGNIAYATNTVFSGKNLNNDFNFTK